MATRAVTVVTTTGIVADLVASVGGDPDGVAPVEQLTISIDDTPGGGTPRVEWGTTSASIPFTVG